MCTACTWTLLRYMQEQAQRLASSRGPITATAASRGMPGPECWHRWPCPGDRQPAPPPSKARCPWVQALHACCVPHRHAPGPAWGRSSSAASTSVHQCRSGGQLVVPSNGLSALRSYRILYVLQDTPCKQVTCASVLRSMEEQVDIGTADFVLVLAAPAGRASGFCRRAALSVP